MKGNAKLYPNQVLFMLFNSVYRSTDLQVYRPTGLLLETRSILCAFFWVIPRRLNFIYRRFGTPCLFHLHRRVGMKKCWNIKFIRRGITQKKAYNIQNKAKIWNKEKSILSPTEERVPSLIRESAKWSSSKCWIHRVKNGNGLEPLSHCIVRCHYATLLGYNRQDMMTNVGSNTLSCNPLSCW